MKVAVSTDNGFVSIHFGRCPEFTIAEITGGKITSKEVIPNPGHATGLLPKFLHEQGVKVLIAGGAGFKAQEFFREYGIKPILGVEGSVDEALKKFAGSQLQGKESACSPGSGKGYGIKKEDGHGE
ncbi:MAG: NifB/NifX family molybdenum-iron cluster-binding protein [Candidatus Diapherotrites archaeon]|nr:NifB/NifX family molybdenum-iron cluster-binding protein [Candidatus Diapherotrites archaeon]